MVTTTVYSSRDVLLAFCRDFLKLSQVRKRLCQALVPRRSQSALSTTRSRQRTGVYRLQSSRGLERWRALDTNDRTRDQIRSSSLLLPKLRLPAVSRLQKFHITCVWRWIDWCKPMWIFHFVEPNHIVDGYREMVFKLLWAVVARCCLNLLLSAEQVRTEMARIQKFHGISQRAALSSPAIPSTADDREHENVLFVTVVSFRGFSLWTPFERSLAHQSWYHRKAAVQSWHTFVQRALQCQSRQYPLVRYWWHSFNGPDL